MLISHTRPRRIAPAPAVSASVNSRPANLEIASKAHPSDVIDEPDEVAREGHTARATRRYG
jgi:hypothetical protein